MTTSARVPGTTSSRGVRIAKDVDDLHGDNNNLTKQTVLNEEGEVTNGRGYTSNRHDILTGSQLDGTIFSGGADTTCQNWTCNIQGSARVGPTAPVVVSIPPRGTQLTAPEAAARKICGAPAETACSTALPSIDGLSFRKLLIVGLKEECVAALGEAFCRSRKSPA